MNLENEQKDDKPQMFFYLQCKGKFEEGENGEKRQVCTGHLFAPDANLLFTECPVCGQRLAMLESKTPRAAAALAKEECLLCENRVKSTAVNDLKCVGGESRQNGGLKKIKGTQACNGCLCAGCCKNMIDDFNIGKRFGIGKVISAKGEMLNLARWLLQNETESQEERNRRYDETKANNPVLKNMATGIFVRWLDEAEKEARRFSGGAAKGNMNKLLEKAVGEIKTPW